MRYWFAAFLMIATPVVSAQPVLYVAELLNWRVQKLILHPKQ